MSQTPRNLFMLASGIFCILSGTDAQAALIIDATFDSTITGDANSAAIQAGINAAIARAQNAISNNITVSIYFTELTSGSSPGASVTSTYFNTTYSQYRSLLAS